MVIKIPEQLRNCRFIKVAEKRPIEKDWQNEKNYSYDEMSKILETVDSYGVLCGRNNLVVIDFDNEEIQKEMFKDTKFIRDTFTVKTAGKGLYHCYFFLKNTNNIQNNNIAINDNNGVRIIDVQVNRKMVVGPGTILSNGRSYEIVKDAPIPVGGSLQILDGGAKIVMVSGDALKVKSSVASSADVWVSVVDAIST